MKLVMFIFIFLMLGSLIIIENNHLSMYKSESQKIFIDKFTVWVSGIYKNLQSITGDVIKMNWFYK